MMSSRQTFDRSFTGSKLFDQLVEGWLIRRLDVESLSAMSDSLFDSEVGELGGLVELDG
jgi:hypothetical protein